MEEDLKCAPRLPGCGTQHPHRALGGTRVLLAAAPTTPPCFRRWRRSSSLHFGHQERKEYFLFAVPKRLRAFRNCFFMGEIAVESLSGAHSFATLFLRPKRVRKGFFRAFQGDSMHFRGHSRRIALLLPPFVVYYKHRAVLCSICHSRNSYRAENRPVTANRAVFCFLRVRVVHGSFQRICGAIRAQNRPKRAKRGTLGTTKSARLGRALEKERILCKNGSSVWFWR